MIQITGTRFLPYDLLKKKFGTEKAEEIIAATSPYDFTPDDYPNT